MNSHTQTHEIRADMAGLIRLLAKNLYAQPDVFIREMIQNAHDAIQRRRELDGDDAPAGLIQLHVDRSQDNPAITFEDNGAGLTEAQIHEYLSTIGRSGTNTFRRQLLEKGRYAEAKSLIGQFGIGLLSAFVVANRVVVHTRSCRPRHASHQGWRWECWGDKTYTLTSDDNTPVGSRVTLYIDPNHRHVLDSQFIRKTVRMYADFISVPIHLNQEGRINVVDAPWHRSYVNEDNGVAEYAEFVARRFSDDALSVLPVDIVEPYPVQGVLYISNRRFDLSLSGCVDIYQSRMFIAANHPDLLPSWANFVGGVIDSTALTPTAARDNVQMDAAFLAVQDSLGRLIIEHLKQMADQNPQNFKQIMDRHHDHIKRMALNMDFFHEIADLLPFETNKGPMSLKDYLAQTVKSLDGRQTILYFSEGGQATQFFMLADAKEILVINASLTYDSQFLRLYAQKRADVKLEQLDFTGSDIIFQKLDPSAAASFRELKKVFGLKMLSVDGVVKIVRFSPPHIPAIVALTEAQKQRREMHYLKDTPTMPFNISKLLELVLEDSPSIPVTLYLNAENPTIQALRTMNLESQLANTAMKAIYHNALMLAQPLITRRNAEVMFTQFNEVINQLIKQAPQRTQRRAVANKPHVSCLLILDDEQKPHVFEALRDILQDRPYFWQLVPIRRSLKDGSQVPELARQIKNADCFVVELSDDTPNLLLELSMILVTERPCLLLWDKRSIRRTEEGDILGISPVEYDPFESPDQMRKTLKEAMQKQVSFQAAASPRHAKFLSPVILRETGFTQEMIEAICHEYKTVKDFVTAKAATIAQQTGSNQFIIHTLQHYIRHYCRLD